MLSGLRNEKRQPYSREIFRADLKAGITLSASYVPTAMALGVVSGMGPLAGLWCGVFVGIIAGLCGGTRALISGPSAVLAVITATLLTGPEVSLPELGLIIAMAGAIQIVLGLTGVGRFVSYMPHIVLVGFMSGIGVLILWSQAGTLVELGMSNLALAAGCLAVFVVWPGRIDRFIPAASRPSRSAGSSRHSCPGSNRWAPFRSGCRSRRSSFPRSTSCPRPSDRRC